MTYYYSAPSNWITQNWRKYCISTSFIIILNYYKKKKLTEFVEHLSWAVGELVTGDLSFMSLSGNWEQKLSLKFTDCCVCSSSSSSSCVPMCTSSPPKGSWGGGGEECLIPTLLIQFSFLIPEETIIIIIIMVIIIIYILFSLFLYNTEKKLALLSFFLL